MAPPEATARTAAAARKRYLRKKRKNHKFKVLVRDPSDNGRLRYQMNQQQQKKKRNAANGLKLTDLPADLLAGEILSGLHLADRLRFGATCKSNYSLITDKNLSLRREIDELPWLATFSTHFPGSISSAGFMMYHPISRRGQPPYARFEIKYPKQETFHHVFNRVIATKLGWLLFCWPAGTSFTSTSSSSSSLLLFSPFNRRFIKLPEVNDCVDRAIIGQTCVATFSSCPSSPGCGYFFLTQNIIPGKVTISTMSTLKRKREWKTLLFDELIQGIGSVAYHDGLFYCISDFNEGGNLAAYDHVHHHWTKVITSSPLLKPNNFFVRRFHILEFHGNLVLVYRDMSMSFNGPEDICSLFVLCNSTKTWVQKTSLEDNAAIFLGGSPFAVSAPSGVANKIYFCGHNKFHTCPMYYSLADGKSYLCHGNTYWSNAIRDSGIWIQPPPLLKNNPSNGFLT